MTTIYNSPVLHVTYDEQKERANLNKINGFNSASVAYLLNTDDSSCWDNFKTFVLKYFTWTWITSYPSPTPHEDLAVLLASYAISEYKYVDEALRWIKSVASVFVPQHISAKAMQELMDLVK